MKILITGGSGLLGKSLLETKPKDTELILTWLGNLYGLEAGEIWYRLDVLNKSDVFYMFHMFRPDIVIHCAAIGSVDYAESHYDEVSTVNFGGTQNIVKAANEIKAKVVYISTNAIYSGEQPPYNETSPLDPINAYGIIKKRAEQYVRDTAENWLIIRPFLLYGWPYQGGRDNWANTIIKKLRGGKNSFKMVNDCFWQPTYAPDCAAAIWKLLFQFQNSNEIFNIASPERSTLYEFALKVCDMFELEKNLVRPVDSKFFPSIARRPVDTTYDLKKLTTAGIIMMDIKTGLERMKEVEK